MALASAVSHYPWSFLGLCCHIAARVPIVELQQLTTRVDKEDLVNVCRFGKWESHCGSGITFMRSASEDLNMDRICRVSCLAPLASSWAGASSMRDFLSSLRCEQECSVQ